MRYLILAFALLFSACAPLPGSTPDAKVTIIGDSVLAWHRNTRQSVGNALADELGAPVANFSISASRISQPNPAMQFTRMQIPNQFDDRTPEWVILNGGANDVYFECLCLKCPTVVDQLVATKGGGEIPELMLELRKTGAQIMYVGYHRSGGLGSAYDRCANELDVIEARVKAFTDGRAGMYFVDMKDIFPPRDTSFYDNDYIHPSPLGSATIAKRLAVALRDAGFDG
ncbi:MAG: SGNH/GDSL hydrolase family protein [Planktomarina sp.]